MHKVQNVGELKKNRRSVLKEREYKLKRIKNWKPIANWSTGKLKMEWLNDVREDFRRKKKNWKRIIGDREEWKNTVELSKSHIELYCFVMNSKLAKSILLLI